MASTMISRSPATCVTTAAAAEAASSRRKSASSVAPFVSQFYGSQLTAKMKEVGLKRVQLPVGRICATATVDTGVKQYTLPTWAEFEMGHYPVYWETATGEAPMSGERLTIIFNSASSKLVPSPEYGIAFNGGFNQPIMCGGEPRVMTKKERGSQCVPFFYIKINVPKHATSLEFSFTDGVNWDGPYKLFMEIPEKLKGLPQSYFNAELAKELAHEGACDSAIYPEAVFVQDRCAFPAGLIQQGGDRCELDIVPGCTDRESPFFDPLANVDDGSCPFIGEE